MWPRLREPLLFTVGAAGFIHEMLSTGPERQTLTIACVSLMLGGVVAEADKRRSK